MNFYNRISKTQRTPSVTKEYADSFIETTGTSSTTDTTSIISTTNTSKKQIKPSEIDKIKIIRMFEDLELDTCWRLSSGTTVEERMKEFAVGCDYEQ
ncbi:hypothetical protein BDF21DRAFT_344874 [Thamnidium elegans]|nr:hypothetical protein BDF21DRAFT_344874 [Thamnidium elegans]